MQKLKKTQLALARSPGHGPPCWSACPLPGGPSPPVGGPGPARSPFPRVGCTRLWTWALDDSWGDDDGVEMQAPGWGQWAAFPGDPPPRPTASPEHPVPPRPPVAAPSSGTAGASGPASGRGHGRGAWGAAARRQEAPSCSPGEGGGVRRGHCWWRAPEPSGSRCSHRVRTCCPRPGGSGWGGARPRGPDGGGDTWPLRGSSRAAREGGWRPGRTGGSALSPRRSLRFAVPPAGSREAPRAFRRIFGARGLGAEGGTALSRVRRHGAPLPAPVPLAPAPVFRETRPHQGAGFHLRAPVPRSGTQGAPCDRCCGEGAGEAPAGLTGLPS